MDVKRLVVNATILPIIHGNINNKVKMIANIFGIKVNVISCICVTACNMDITKPTTKPANNKGADIINVVIIARFANSSTNSWVICYSSLLESGNN